MSGGGGEQRRMALAEPRFRDSGSDALRLVQCFLSCLRRLIKGLRFLAIANPTKHFRHHKALASGRPYKSCETLVV
jgi:hypothetical protein